MEALFTCDSAQLVMLFILQEWKAGKRKAECDKLCGAAFFLTVKSPTTAISIDEA